MSIIRKINVGPDLMNSMIYSVGQAVGEYKIRDIKRDEDYEIHVYVINDAKERFLWKTITPSVPVTIEYDLNF
jgi:hypothetical protein